MKGIAPALACLLAAGRLEAQAGPEYHRLQLDCSTYRQSVHSTIELESRGQRSRESSDRDGRLRLRAVARDTLLQLEAWFDSLVVVREGAGERLVPETDGLIGGRYTGLLNRSGGFTSTDTPFVPDEVAQVAEVSDALAELLPPLPPGPLRPGAGWRDGFGTVIQRMPDGTRDGRRVERYRLTRRLEREERRLLPDSSEVVAQRRESERGSYDWAPDVGLVRWERTITVDVEVPAGEVVKQPFRTRIQQQVTVERVAAGEGCR